MPTPEDLSERFVILPSAEPGGSHHVELVAPGAAAVVLGPFPNPALAREKAEAVRLFLAAALRAAGHV